MAAPHKLDALGRLQLEEGLPPAGVNITIRLHRPDEAAARQVQRAGLKLHAQVGEILVGHVANETDLNRITDLACVQEVQLARPLYADRAAPSTNEG